MNFIKKRITSVLAAAALCMTMVPTVAAERTYTLTLATEGGGTASAPTTVLAKDQTVQLTAVASEGYEFDHWEVTPTATAIGSSVKSADIVFVIDSTGSMGSEIRDVKTNLKSFINILEGKGVDLNMSVLEYRDIYEDGEETTKYYTFANGTHWTTNAGEVEATLDAIVVNGGGDTFETPTDAFGKMITESGDLNFTGTTPNRFLFLLTDAPFKDFEDTPEEHAKNHYSMKSWVEKFSANDVKVSVVTNDYSMPYYKDLFSKTGGESLDIESEDYAALMSDYAKFIDSHSVPVNISSTSETFSINMPNCNITAKAVFKKKQSTYKIEYYLGLPHSYIYSYTADGEAIKVNCNRKFTQNSTDVSVTVNLGSDYAGKSYVLYTNKSAKGGSVVSDGTLNSKGKAVITVPMGKNFHLIVED